MSYASGGLQGVGISMGARPERDAAVLLGVSDGEALSLFRYVIGQRLVVLSGASDLDRSVGRVSVGYVSEEGLQLIGKLPDPKERLVAGLEAALHIVQQDPTLDQQQKEEKLRFGREALEFARGLAVEAAARVLMG